MPRLRLRRLTSEPGLFDAIEFTDGLNLILGEKWSDTEIRGRKVNGVGKTLCVEFIEFGLLKKFPGSRLSKVPMDVLPEEQTIILELEIGDTPVRVHRTIGDHRRPIISVGGGTGRMMNTLEDGLSLLASLQYADEPQDAARPSFRELLSLLARDEDSEFKDILSESKYPANLRPHLYLLGLPLAVYDELRRTKKTVQDGKKMVSRFRERFTDGRRLSIDAARAELNKAEASVQEIADALDVLEAEPAVAAREADLLRIEEELEKLRLRRQGLTYELDQITSVPKFEEIDERDMEIIYNSFKQSLGGMIVRELQEVVAFKRQIEDFQEGLLGERRTAIAKERASLSRKISALSREYATLVRSLDKKGVLKELKLGLSAAQQQSADYYSRREAERNFHTATAEVEDGQDTWHELTSELRRSLAVLEGNVRSVEQTILRIHENVMGDRNASFAITVKPQLSRREPLDFSLRIRDDGSHSVNRTKVFIYDWALLSNASVAPRHPGFLLHDNLFDVDQDTLVRSLNLVHESSNDGLQFQYILTLNRDKIENEERQKEIVFDVDSYRRARFTKEQPFLGVAYQELPKSRA